MKSYLNGILIGAMLGAAAAIYLQDRKIEEVPDRYKDKAGKMRRILNVI